MASRFQSNIGPMERSCPRIRSMFSHVQIAGCTLLLIAAFSAGSPNASKPIGNRTLKPFIRMTRALASDGAIAYQWPMCKSPDV